MINIQDYLENLTGSLKEAFGSRLLYIGLQGSYLRGEATESSDVDIMAVVDGLDHEDLKKYREAIESLGDFDKSCGFICGRQELEDWNPLELCHVLKTTKDYYGCLAKLMPPFSRRNIADYIKVSVGNLYHALCHRRIHAEYEKSVMKLPQAKRDVFFILQNMLYLEKGEFIGTGAEMGSKLCGSDLKVWNVLTEISGSDDYDFDSAFGAVLDWCGEILERCSIVEYEKDGGNRKFRLVDDEIILVPYYPNYDASLPWYQDHDVVRQVDNRDELYDIELLQAMYNYLNEKGECYYIEYKGTLCGDVTLQDNGDIAIVVCKEFQNKHIGRRCVAEMLTLADEKGIAPVRANIYSFNRQSQKMFLAAGFRQTAEEWFEYGEK